MGEFHKSAKVIFSKNCKNTFNVMVHILPVSPIFCVLKVLISPVTIMFPFILSLFNR